MSRGKPPEPDFARLDKALSTGLDADIAVVRRLIATAPAGPELDRLCHIHVIDDGTWQTPWPKYSGKDAQSILMVLALLAALRVAASRTGLRRTTQTETATRVAICIEGLVVGRGHAPAGSIPLAICRAALDYIWLSRRAATLKRRLQEAKKLEMDGLGPFD